MDGGKGGGKGEASPSEKDLIHWGDKIWGNEQNQVNGEKIISAVFSAKPKEI